MFIRILLAATGLSAALSGKAEAQIAPGVSGSSSTTYIDGEEYWTTVRDFGVCFAGVDRALAWELIATTANSKEEAAVYRKLSKGSQPCLSNTDLGRPPVAFIRGSIAEGLYKRGTPVPPTLVLAAPPLPDSIRTLGEAARCVVAARRPQVHELLATTLPGSKRELAALQQLSTVWFSCLPEAAQKRGFNPTQIRYRLAEALLRMPEGAPIDSPLSKVSH